MPVHNHDIAKTFLDLADYLEIEQANPFRIRAYRNAARTLKGLAGSVAEMVGSGRDLTKIPGIGKDLAKKIETIVATGSLPQLEELESRLPSGLQEVMQLSGIGPKKTASLYRDLGITDLASLQQAAESGKVRQLEGFGVKTENTIIEEIRRSEERDNKRTLLIEAEEYAEALLDYLQQVQGVEKAVVAGSFRRCRPTVGDLDILVSCATESGGSSAVMDAFTSYEDGRKVVSKGESRTTVLLQSGLQVDVRLVPKASYGAALHYFTGSREHNIAVRRLGIDRGYKINEYGVFAGEKKVAGRTEEEVYAAVGLPYIEPELRENRGEIEAALRDELPRLICRDDLQGDLHVHTRESDGRDSLEELAEAAAGCGYEYLAVTDHSRQVRIANGLDEERLLKQIEAVDELNDRLEGLTLLKGIEVDILRDGSLDLADDILRRLDLRVCSVHSSFRLSRQQQTERILKAMDNPLFNILAHPSGRLINARDPYEVDMERIMEGALERGCFLELNSQPDRLDLADVHLQRARQLGLRVAVSTDAHWRKHFDRIRYGIQQARRGWLEPGDVINTRSLSSLRELLRR